MQDYNSWTGVGRLVADPEMRFTVEGVAVANFRIAVSGWKDNEVDFISIKTFKKTAEICGEYLRKGKQVLIEGRLQNRSYEKDGEKKYITEIIANQVQLLGKKDD